MALRHDTDKKSKPSEPQSKVTKRSGKDSDKADMDRMTACSNF